MTSAPAPSTVWTQEIITLSAKRRGCHLVTDELVKPLQRHLAQYAVGLAHLFVQHTSCSLTVNENADPDVRHDMETMLSDVVPDGYGKFRHTLEGPDDMAAHVKSTLTGAGTTVPVRDGRLLLGTWQGVWLCEHREHGGPRRVVVTIQGQQRKR